MKTLLTLSLAAVLFGSRAGNEEVPEEYETPPGTIHLHDNVFIDAQAIRNVDYREFLYYIQRMDWNIQDTAWEYDNMEELHAKNKGENNTKYPHAAQSDVRKYLPDTNLYKDLPLITSQDGKKGSMSTYYFRHPYFQEHPLTAITYEQAKAYCVWRSNRVNEAIYLREGCRVNFRVRYRLPTAEEYRMASEKYTFMREYEHKGKHLSRKDVFQPVTEEKKIRWFWEAYEYKFFMHDYNVAEMLATEGKAIGLSVKDSAQTDPLYIQDYQEAQYWLGFRCVAVVEKVE